MYQDLEERLSQECVVLLNEPMKKHTYFQIGGVADCFVVVNSLEDLKRTLSFCKENKCPWFLLGNGSNLLVSDKGIRGITIKLGEAFDYVERVQDCLFAGAAVNVGKLAKVALENSLTGMEWAYGIPGNLAGAVYMNAGAYGGEFAQIVTETEYLDSNLEKGTLSLVSHGFGYRGSVFQTTLKDCVILASKIQLQLGNKVEIEAKMQDYLERRTSKQPINMPSAGSVFRRPNNAYVGQMIEELGLKGFQIGGAKVSEKHAGFIVNCGNATAQDVKNLIQYIQERVEEKYQIRLKTEIKEVGE